jgi:hypothetical protein
MPFTTGTGRLGDSRQRGVKIWVQGRLLREALTIVCGSLPLLWSESTSAKPNPSQFGFHPGTQAPALAFRTCGFAIPGRARQCPEPSTGRAGHRRVGRSRGGNVEDKERWVTERQPSRILRVVNCKQNLELSSSSSSSSPTFISGARPGKGVRVGGSSPLHICASADSHALKSSPRQPLPLTTPTTTSARGCPRPSGLVMLGVRGCSGRSHGDEA